MDTADDTERFATFCKTLLRDNTKYSTWFASAGVCSRCDISLNAACIRLPGAFGCNPCVVKKIKCPHQEEYLFEYTQHEFYALRSEFDAHRASARSRRPRASRHLAAVPTVPLVAAPRIPGSSVLHLSDFNPPLSTVGLQSSIEAPEEIRMSLSTGIVHPASLVTTPPLSVPNPSTDAVYAPHHPGSSGGSPQNGDGHLCHDPLSFTLSRDMHLLDKETLLDVVSFLLTRIKALEDRSMYMQEGTCTSPPNPPELRRSCAEVVAACHFRLAVAHRVTKLRLASPSSFEDVLPSSAEVLLANMFDEADSVFATLSGSLNELLQSSTASVIES
ncbi:hypothetical protein B0H11DRAFT_1959428 [Mycena galericulata]|nr:hypothetical protein B0H11DRAFT_1959428 [Mycena galericulata]